MCRRDLAAQDVRKPTGGRLPEESRSSLGHGADSLYFQSPLQGNYSIECETTTSSWEDSHVLAGGMWVASVADLKSYRLGTIRGEHRLRDIAPKLVKPVGWNLLRTVARDGVITTYVNGRQLHSERLPEDHVPWVAIHSYIRRNGVTRNIRITGNPLIPDRLQLTAVEKLSGWVSYFDESVGGATADWRPLDDLSNGDGIIGMRRPISTGQVSRLSGHDEITSGNRMAETLRESLLQYHRPMLEDGEIEYEFYYQLDESHTHPALDRLAFMLEPSGVRIHWITDGKYDRTDLDPANISDEPQNRRGSGPLPLKVDSWNRLRLSLVGNVVQLSLNGHDVYERKLEATNQRTFGLFHYSDQTEALVRNVVWRGEWPRSLPPVEEQELAGEGADFLDKDIAQLTAIFEHDFASGGLPADQFKLFEEGWQPFVIEKPDGVHVARSGVKGRFLNYTIAPRFAVQGDFDATASFEKFRPEPATDTTETKCCLMLSAALNNEAQTRAYLNRRHVRRVNRDDDQLVEGSITRNVENQTRRTVLELAKSEAEAGTLRLARRGKKLYFLVAENDSSYYRFVGEETLSDADLHNGGIRMHVMTAGPGTTKVIWKKLTIRATGIPGLPPDN